MISSLVRINFMKKVDEAKLKRIAQEKQREVHHRELVKKQDLSLANVPPYEGDAFIALQHVNKIYPNHVQAVYDFNLEIYPKEFVVFVGPSGCGKSTTLRMIAGLEDITYGNLYINKEFANTLLPKSRDCAMVFQSYALYPNMTVYDNMAYSLKVRRVDKQTIHNKVLEAAKILELEDYLSRKPGELSGGQRQRVALGRAIVRDARIFLMDEPLSNLDAKLRLVMRSEIVKLHNLINATTIYVTHDQTEAMTMASRIVVMSRGFVQQIGTPDEIYDNPKNIFVAKFIGAPSINVFKAVYWNKKLNLDQVTLNLPASVVAKHDNYYQEKLKKLNDINVEFDSNSSEYILKILSALNDEKKVIEEHHKKHLISKIASLFKKSSNEQKVNYDKERKICEEKISELEKALKENHEVLVAVRPEKLKARLLKNNEKLNDGEMKVVVTVSELLGSEYHVHFNYRNIDMVAKFDKGKDVIKIGDELAISFDLKDAFVFDPITGGRIC